MKIKQQTSSFLFFQPFSNDIEMPKRVHYSSLLFTVDSVIFATLVAMTSRIG